MSTTTEIVLQNGHFIRRVTQSVDLGAQEDILSSFAEAPPVFIRNAQNIGRPVHLLVNKNAIVAATELDKLPFNSNWTYDPWLNRMVTRYNAAVEGAVVINEPWVAPANFGKLIFAVLFAIGAGGHVTYRNTYLFQYLGNELYWFPYPNLFEDCRVCMGREFERQMANENTADVSSTLLKAISSFYETKLNSDLTRANTGALFYRDINCEWVYPTRPEEHYHVLTSAAFMRGFAL